MTDRDKKLLIVIGVIVGLAVIKFVFLSGGGDESAAPPVAGVSPTTAVSGAPGAPGVPGATPTGAPVTAPPPAPGENLALGGRDPFSPLPLVSASPSPGSETSPGASPAAPVSPSTKDTEDVEGYTVVLLDVLSDGSAVDVSVDGHKYKNVASGESFGPSLYFHIRAIVDPCADFRYEKKDTKQNFTLCIKS